MPQENHLTIVEEMRQRKGVSDGYPGYELVMGALEQRSLGQRAGVDGGTA